MGSLGANVQFIVKPTLRDGLGIGVAWKLECSKTHILLGKGFGFHVCHEYEGKECGNIHGATLQRNMEPLGLVSQLLLSPNKQPLTGTNPHSFLIAQKLIPFFTAAIMTIPGCTRLIKELSKANKGIFVFLSLLLMVMSFFFLKFSFSSSPSPKIQALFEPANQPLTKSG
ncbi:hypothetical protein Cgig2_005341 [Carnegiea gigantea]|uniref:Uncharacterized protein n=1 Tax=Carnegiea gigantea TaxID=171969 RepID=A0A9Q1K738_9CARY|nr:hypothetical protein Cgig2_005341 [Carnegiea gigantea]